MSVSVACAHGAHTPTHSRVYDISASLRRCLSSFPSLALSLTLSFPLHVADRRSRFAQPAPKIPPYRSHSLAPLFFRSRRRLAARASWTIPDVALAHKPCLRRRRTAGRTAIQAPPHRPTDPPTDQPTNRSNRPTALHYPPSTTGAQPLPCTDAATAAAATATGVAATLAHLPTLPVSFPRSLFSTPLCLSLPLPIVRAVEYRPATPHAYTRVVHHSRLREPAIAPPLSRRLVYPCVCARAPSAVPPPKVAEETRRSFGTTRDESARTERVL